MIHESGFIALGWLGAFDPLMFLEALLRILAWIVLWLGPQIAIGCAAFALCSVQMRRRERAALWLDLVEAGLKEGMAPEQTMMRAASCRDRSLGVRFHLAAAHLEKGCTLPEALGRVPRLLPPQIAAILKAGLATLGFERVVPACRAVLHDGLSQNHSALNWHLLVFFFLSPAQLGFLFFFNIWILPKFEAIMNDMIEGSTELAAGGAMAFMLFHHAWILVVVMLLIYLVLFGVFCAITGGPRVAGWLRRIFGPAWDRCVLAVPWRRKRLERDFIAMLALMLDAELPEEQAVTLAASATANGAFVAMASRAATALRQGTPLPEALRAMNRLPELQWRLINALKGGGRVQDAVAGWCQSLDARAFQQEQAASHLATTSLVLANGLVVGLTAIGIFSLLISIIQQGVLW